MKTRTCLSLALLLACLLGLSACQSTRQAQEKNLLDNEHNSFFLPISPITVWGHYSDGHAAIEDNNPSAQRDGKPSLRPWPVSGNETLDLLYNMQVIKTTYKLTGNTGFKYLTASASAKGESYRTVYDHIYYREEAGADIGYPQFHKVRVGVGLRVIYEYELLESGLKLNGLWALGAEAEAKNLSGSLSIEFLGVTSREIRAVEFGSADISPESIQNVFKAIASLRAHMSNESIKVQPQILAVGVTKKDIDRLEKDNAASKAAAKLKAAFVKAESSFQEVQDAKEPGPTSTQVNRAKSALEDLEVVVRHSSASGLNKKRVFAAIKEMEQTLSGNKSASGAGMDPSSADRGSPLRDLSREVKTLERDLVHRAPLFQ